MSLLQNHTEALNRLCNITPEELERQLGGMDPVSGRVVGALYNADTEGMKNVLLQSNPAGVIAGLKIAALLTGAKGAELVVNCQINQQELEADAGIVDLPLTVTQAALVNKALHKNDRLFSLEELAALADRFMGNEPGLLVALDDGIPSEQDPATPVWQLTGECKGILVDHRFYEADTLENMTLAQLHSRSGVIHRLTPSDCPVDVAKKQILTLREKSCGKCTFCREGLYQLAEIFENISNGRAKTTDLDLAREIGQAMTISCNCTLGEEAGLPALSALEAFAGETLAHVRRKECAANACLALTQFYVDPQLCKGSGACLAVCPAQCIEGGEGLVSVIDGFDCTRCGKCMEVCENGAIKRVSGRLPKLPSLPVPVKGAKLAAQEPGEEMVHRPVKRKRVFAAPVKASQGEETPAIQQTQQPKQIEVKIMKTIETDVVVVAGGPAGLAAAITVGEQGLKSVILEKSSATGGAANMGMGPLGIDTKIQKANFNNLSVEEALQKHMEYTHYRVDEDLVQTYFHKSADTIEWLEEMGVEFAGAFRYFKESEATWHIVKPENGVIGPRAASAMVKAMTQRAKELGSEILLETAATSLITENGKVCGAVAVDKDGNGIEVRGKAVVVATGGFGNNPEMIEKEFGLHIGKDYFPFRIPGITGDGLKMMWEVGAEKFGANIEAIYQLPDNLNWFLLDAVLRQPNLMINQLGERFMNEGDLGNTTYAGNALALQPGNYGYCIMDGAILKEYKKNGPDIVDIVHPAEAFLNFEGQAALAVEQGYEAYFEAETVEELAEKLGIDSEKLQDTIDEYNAMCRRGVDSKFHKPQKYLHPITGKGKYLVGKYYLGAYGTVGGVRVNRYCEVLDKNHMPIEGLYSAGSDANTVYGDSYNFTLPGNSMGFAVNTGRMAGESIAQYIAECC